MNEGETYAFCIKRGGGDAKSSPKGKERSITKESSGEANDGA